MASKSKRAGTATPQPQPGGSATPNVSGIHRQASPLSPTRHSRLQEKAELQNLNDRLACYIDRVRNLETENARLNIEVMTTRENITREATSIKTMYESELSDARRLLDETAREKAKTEIDIKRLWEENEELKAKLERKTKECSIAEGNARMYETRAADLNAKYTAANADRVKAIDDLNELQKELNRIKKQLDDTRKNLEDETLARVDLENTVQSLREELTFKDQIHTQEITETRSRRHVEVSEIDGRLTEEYEMKLQASLQDLRNQYESQMLANREEQEMLYESKIKNLEAAAARNANAASSALEELRSTRTRTEALNSRINDLEATNNALNTRIRDLEQTLDRNNARHRSELNSLENELQHLREEMARMLQEYQDLMDIKVSLDLEIAAYDKLLCGEENRLNITPNTTASSFSQNQRSTRGTPIRKTPSRASTAGLKRKRTIVDETDDLSQSEYYFTTNAKGDVSIVEVNPEERLIKLHNKGSNEVLIGGWQLVANSGGKNETTHKFNRSIKIAPGATATVWSSGTEVTPGPPANIVMKDKKWVGGDNVKVLLLTSEGEEVAGAERIKRTSNIHASRRRGLGEELYHQQGQPEQNGEKCRVM